MNKLNYYCVAICKNVLNKEMLETKEEALLRFEEQFREEILKELKETEKKIGNSINRCVKRLEKMEVEEASSVFSGSEQKIREREKERLLDLKGKREAELEKLQQEMEGVHSFYLWRLDEYKESLFIEPEIRLLRICGVYKDAGGKYSLEDMVYTVISSIVENISNQEEVLRKVLDVIPDDRGCMLCVSEHGKERAIKFVSKERLRLIHEVSKNDRRVAA